MSLYLGRNKVGVTYKDVNPNVIDSETLEELNDAVGYRVGDYKERNIPQMIEELKKDYFMQHEFNVENPYVPWTRPQEWPDLDSLNLQMEGNDFIYMTYDNTKERGAFAWHIEKTSGGAAINVTMGHISNGSYIIDETITGSSNNYVRWLADNDIDYPVFRITGDIYYCYAYAVSKDGYTQHYRKQPLLERIAWVPHLKAFCTNYNNNAWGQFAVQREKVANGTGTALTSLYYAWAYCQELADLDINGLYAPNNASLVATFYRCLLLDSLNLSHWDLKKVASMDSCFAHCRYLKIINLSNCDTLVLNNLANTFLNCCALKEIKGIQNFKVDKVTTLASTFNNCRSIELNLSTWNIERVTSLSSTFATCYAIRELDLSNWDISKVTNCASTFSGCHSLKRINLPEMTTGILTSFSSTFNSCYSLEEIDLSKFLVTNKCTTIYRAFYYCYSLKELDFSTWDISGLSTGDSFNSLFYNCYSLEKITGISNWHINSNNLTGAFYYCYKLRELDISGWTTNNCTNMSSMFCFCCNLRELDLSNFDTSKCTTLNSMFYACFSLVEIRGISTWDTSKVTSMASMFRACWSLKNFPAIQNWDLSNVTSMDSMFCENWGYDEIIWDNVNISKCTNIYQLFRYNYNLRKISTKNWTLNSNIVYSASYYQIYGDCWSLEDVEGILIPSTYLHIGFGACDNLSYESALRIINALPQVSTAHTLHIPSSVQQLLTTGEKAIATNKNWTIAT